MFADEVTALATSAAEIIDMVADLRDALSRVGLRPQPGKCAIAKTSTARLEKHDLTTKVIAAGSEDDDGAP
eukprot:13979764-Alexandrium_andersonii.AAC.1